MLKTHQIKVEPNAHMRQHIEDLFNYRRYCWNKALGIWNDLYDESVVLGDKKIRPTEYAVRNILVANKQDWQYALSSRVLQQATRQLDKAWKNYFNPKMTSHRRPKFKSKKNYKPTFTTDRAKIVDGKLLLDKPSAISKSVWYGIKLREQPRFEGTLKLCTVVEKADGFYASLLFDTTQEQKEPLKQGVTGVDVNVKRLNHKDGVVNIYPKKLDRYYQRITHYQRILAHKRVDNPHNFRTIRYAKAKAKLRRDYQKVHNLQMDILQKFTTELVTNYGEIHIEDLNVHGMMMSKHMGKNLQRSMFGELSVNLAYKCLWNNRKLVLVDRFYPSTQICSECGFCKTKDGYGGKQALSGDSIHHQHQTYYCYNCGAVLDRDENAVKNIINYQE